jgi:hypothetical protein
MKLLYPGAATVLAALMLSACGGGDEGAIVIEEEPRASGLSASATVAGATGPDAAFNGAYATTDLRLNNVTKVNPIGGAPETCRFRFGGLGQVTGTGTMGGDIRYVPGTNNLQASFISINGVEFNLDGTTGGTVDRPGNRVVFTAAVLTSTQGSGRSITLNASIPMRDNRPEGC